MRACGWHVLEAGTRVRQHLILLALPLTTPRATVHTLCVLTVRACVRVALAARRYICAACFVMCGGTVRRQQSALAAACDSQQPPSLPPLQGMRSNAVGQRVTIVRWSLELQPAVPVPGALSYFRVLCRSSPSCTARPRFCSGRPSTTRRVASTGRQACSGCPPQTRVTYGRVRPVPVQGVDIWSVGCIFAEMVKGEVTAAAPHRVCVGTLSALHRLGPCSIRRLCCVMYAACLPRQVLFDGDSEIDVVFRIFRCCRTHALSHCRRNRTCSQHA